MSSIGFNLNSLITQHNLSRNLLNLGTSLQRLSTGYRINRGADDPAGLIAAEYLRSELTAMDAAVRGAERADMVANTADAALGEISNLLTEARGIEVQMANGAGLSDAERDALQLELDSIMDSVDRIGSSTQFNGEKLFTGEADLTYANRTVDLPHVASRNLGGTEIDGETYHLSDLKQGADLHTDYESGEKVINAAISEISTLRGKIGAFQKDHLRPTIRSHEVAMENLAAAESMIRDTNYAFQTAELARNQVLVASNYGSLGIANSQPTNVLHLISSASMIMNTLGSSRNRWL